MKIPRYFSFLPISIKTILWLVKLSLTAWHLNRVSNSSSELMIMTPVLFLFVCFFSFFSFFRFTPEQLGITASSALVWLFVEIMAILFSMYICNVQAEIKWLDLLAFCGYKYFGYVFKLTHRPRNIIFINSILDPVVLKPIDANPILKIYQGVYFCTPKCCSTLIFGKTLHYKKSILKNISTVSKINFHQKVKNMKPNFMLILS